MINELTYRAARVQRETELLLVAFARGCCVRRHVEQQMQQDLRELLASVPGPGFKPTYSTAQGITPTTIPAL